MSTVPPFPFRIAVASVPVPPVVESCVAVAGKP